MTATAFPSLTLQGDDLSWLDLMLTGALDNQYRAPRGAADDNRPHIRVHPEIATAARDAGGLDLLDPEGVTLGRVSVSAVAPGTEDIDRQYAWVVGDVYPVTGFSHLDNLDLRRTPAELVAVTPDDQTVIALWTDTPSARSLRMAAAELANDRDASVLEIVPVPSGQETMQAGHLAPRLARLADTRRSNDVAVVVPAPALAWTDQDVLQRARIVRSYGANFLALAPHIVSVLATATPSRAAELGVEIVPLAVQPEHSELSDAALDQHLVSGDGLPSWFAEPAVASEIARLHRPVSRAGFTVLLSGLSGSGKSTVARALAVRLLENETRSVTLLDGDVVRHHLSKGLGFNRVDRDTNVRRIGYVASEITKAGGIAIACPIAPYDETRRDVRAMVEQYGGFLLVHVATPLEECERRDRKGLYAKARRGEIPEFTGISDPYDIPTDAEVVVDTTGRTIESCVDDVVRGLEAAGYIGRR